MTRTINPERGTLEATAEALDNSDPVVMINLLKYRETAEYPDGIKCSGREAYATYSKHAFQKVKEAGGEVIFHGHVRAGVIVPADESWDEILLIRYPSFQAFRDMISNREYQKISMHRTAALEDSRLLLSQSP